MVKKLKTRCFSRTSLKASVLLSHFSLPTPITDTTHQKEHNHQEKSHEFLMPLESREALGTQSIRTRERLRGLLKYYAHEAA